MNQVNINEPERLKCRGIRCLQGEIAPYVLLPGDPGRADKIGQEYFEDGKLIVRNREFTSYTGYYHGVPVSVVSTGIGCPSAAMAILELINIGARVFIRVGTAGSIQPYVRPGDLVVAMGSVRDEGLTSNYVPLSYPAVSDPDIVHALRDAAEESDTVHTGIVHTSDVVYSPRLQEQISVYQTARVLAFEMESSALFTISSIKGVTAGAIFSIDGYVGNIAKGNYEADVVYRDRGIDRMIITALSAIEGINTKENA